MTVEGPGYFGKLPGSGDFVSRGLSRPLIAGLDAWLHDGLAAMPGVYGPGWLDHYLVAPAWSFILPAGTWSGTVLLGSMIPSVDRVGRYFPLVALVGLPDATPLQACLPPASDWYAATRALLLRALQTSLSPDALILELARIDVHNAAAMGSAAAEDDILSILGADLDPSADRAERPADFVWPEMPLLFEARNDRSFWWADASAAQPARQLIHRGSPDNQLFAQLFSPQPRG